MLDKAGLVREYFKTIELLNEALDLPEFKLEPFQVILQAGGALVALDVRESTSDLDLAIPGDIFKRLKRSREYRTYMFGDVEVMPFTPVADLHVFTGKWDSKFETQDGVWLPSIKEQIELKTTLLNLPQRNKEKREADLRDIKALKKLNR